MIPATQSPRAIGTFNGDFDELAALINRSWSENKEQPLLYTSEFLRSAFDYPGAGFELAPAIYRDGRLVAFVAGFPRTVRYRGETKRLLSVSYLTVAPESKRSGYGPVIWGELLQRARRLGFDGGLDFTVEGDPWNRQILAVARVLRQPTTHIFTVSFMARLLKGNESAPLIEAADCEASSVLVEAASQVSEAVPLARQWSPLEADWQCSRRVGAINAVVCGERRGILNGYTIQTSGASPMLCVMLDDILWGSLTPEECTDLAKLFLSNAAQRGARMAITPILGYADIQPLVSAGFRKTRRALHAYLTLGDGSMPAPISAMYMDVF